MVVAQGRLLLQDLPDARSPLSLTHGTAMIRAHTGRYRKCVPWHMYTRLLVTFIKKSAVLFFDGQA